MLKLLLVEMEVKFLLEIYKKWFKLYHNTQNKLKRSLFMLRFVSHAAEGYVASTLRTNLICD